MRVHILFPDAEGVPPEVYDWLRNSTAKNWSMPKITPVAQVADVCAWLTASRWDVSVECEFDEPADAMEFYFAWHGVNGIRVTEVVNESR